MRYRLILKPSLLLTIDTALESSHAIWEGVRIAKTLPKDKDIVIVSSIFTMTSVVAHKTQSACLDVETRT